MPGSHAVSVNLIALAIPAFFLMMGVELLVARLQRRPDYYRLNDAMTDISCGIGSEVVGVFIKGALLIAYTVLWQSFALFELSTPVEWVVAAVGVDLAYYGWHRANHRVNFLWAGHIVHHHSQDYNLAVALRQAWFTRITRLPFMVPLALLGVSPLVFVINDALNTLYQFWIHTRTVGRLGFLEWFLNTPSHHRVHHAVNPRYIDRNYGGVLIIWDRLFGSFEAEHPDDRPVYGTVKVFQSWNPIWANFHYWVDLWHRARAQRRWRHKLAVWFVPPGWSPDGERTTPEIDASTHRKWDLPVASGLKRYVLIHFVPITLETVALLAIENEASGMQLGLLASAVLWATWTWGGLFESKRWAGVAEALRLCVTPVILSAVAWSTPWLLPTALVSGLLSVGSLWWLWRASPAFAQPADGAHGVDLEPV